jgi:hypothetical protein
MVNVVTGTVVAKIIRSIKVVVITERWVMYINVKNKIATKNYITAARGRNTARDVHFLARVYSMRPLASRLTVD